MNRAEIGTGDVSKALLRTLKFSVFLAGMSIAIFWYVAAPQIILKSAPAIEHSFHEGYVTLFCIVVAVVHVVCVALLLSSDVLRASRYAAIIFMCSSLVTLALI